ncbi:MAG: acyl-CoA synthetase FdrA [Brevinemataceae bacterium]
MFSKLIIKNNFYKDSITLMSVTNKVNNLDGVLESTLGMGTDMNKEIIKSIGFSEEELQSVKANDMMIALKLENESFLDKILEQIAELFIVKDEDNTNYAYSNSKQAISENKNLNMAVISIPGNHAYHEVKRCLDNNINVMLFSDNMSIEDELKLKQLAVSKDLLMMGPDCGTSIINGIGLCFANKVRKGNIGIVGASGTGIQEATVLIDKLGAGISHAIGTGGRDLSQEIGGLMMMQGMKMLEQDSQTDIVLLISKPPAKEIAEKILDQAKKSSKTYIICFINGDKNLVEEKGFQFAMTLEEAGFAAANASLSKVISPDFSQEQIIASAVQKTLKQGQRYLRALYCGGTLAAETEMIVGKDHMVYSNVSKIKERKLSDPFVSKENSIIDLGDDVFTQGKPHPMIDPSIRNSRIIKEAQDKSVAVMILDFELGYGSNSNPVGMTVESLKKAKQIAKDDSREIVIICYLLSTKGDKQNIQEQKRLLEDLDVIMVNSNAEAARIASAVIKEL